MKKGIIFLITIILIFLGTVIGISQINKQSQNKEKIKEEIVEEPIEENKKSIEKIDI